MSRADAEGILEGKRRVLERLLEIRIKDFPYAVSLEIRYTEDDRQLDAWLDAAATAKTLSDIPFKGYREE